MDSLEKDELAELLAIEEERNQLCYEHVKRINDLLLHLNSGTLPNKEDDPFFVLNL